MQQLDDCIAIERRLDRAVHRPEPTLADSLAQHELAERSADERIVTLREAHEPSIVRQDAPLRWLRPSNDAYMTAGISSSDQPGRFTCSARQRRTCRKP